MRGTCLASERLLNFWRSWSNSDTLNQPGTPSGLEPRMKHVTHFDGDIDDLAFVPTMGALHEGHLSLIKRARELGKKVLVSVYVNPTQFESEADLTKYPKTLERDLELSAEAGADFLWTPTVAEIYPEGLDNVKLIPAGHIGDLYEGVARPNHFSGVLTVINRLFSIAKPRYAIFGEKDFQQLFLIRKFAQDNFPKIEIISGATIRDKHGIALSSRNSRLSDSEMEIAQVLPRARVKASQTSATKLRDELVAVLAAQPGFTLDYVAIVDPNTLLPVANDFQGQVQVLLAGWIGLVRLIDNFSYGLKGQL
jgi:pantoate--beta-alanine ligase